MGENIYYAIGFPNNKDGYELRSKNYKGCTNKHITTIIENGDSKDYMIFEGFFDFLSFKAIYPAAAGNSIILNSVCNLSAVMKELESLQAEDIYVFGDTDDEGKKVFEKIKERYGDGAIDMSYFYNELGCKDLNEYLVKYHPRKQLRL
jgi:5S rRNA maturation endonuclease (ribonuclease M5)